MPFVQQVAKRVLSPLLPEKWKRYVKAELFHVPDVEASLRRMKHLGFAPAVAIDVGAYVGDWTRSFKQIFPNSRVLMVEPQKAKLASLEAVAADLPNVELRSVLLGPEAQANVGFRESETASSVLEEAANKQLPNTYMVMTTLDAITAGTPFATPGFSAEYMGRHGFQVYDICELMRRPYDSALWQADIIFVRNSSALLYSKRWC